MYITRLHALAPRRRIQLQVIIHVGDHSADPPRPNLSSPACPQPHAVVPHYKQSNTFPMSLEDYQKIIIQFTVFYLRSGLVFAALAVCHYCTQLYVSASILLCRSAAISHFAVQSHTDPMVVRGDDKLCAKQHLPYVPGGLSKKTNTVYCILPPFWVGACLVRHKLSLCITNLCPRRRPIACPRRIASLPQRCFCSICVLLL